MAISDNLRKILGREDVPPKNITKAIKTGSPTVKREAHNSYKLPIDNNLFISGFKKLYKLLYERDFIMTQEAKSLILHFNTNQECENVIVIGGTGTGKTSIMCTLSHLLIYTDQPRFDVHYMPKASQDFRKFGDGALNVYTRGYACLDDVGSEQLGMYFGSKINISEELIELRYAQRLRTHITTNLRPEQLEENLGSRAYSRMVENSKLFVIKGNDNRRI